MHPHLHVHTISMVANTLSERGFTLICIFRASCCSFSALWEQSWEDTNPPEIRWDEDSELKEGAKADCTWGREERKIRERDDARDTKYRQNRGEEARERSEMGWRGGTTSCARQTALKHCPLLALCYASTPWMLKIMLSLHNAISDTQTTNTHIPSRVCVHMCVCVCVCVCDCVCVCVCVCEERTNHNPKPAKSFCTCALLL